MELTCICDETFDVEFPPEASLDSGDRIAKILDGAWFDAICPRCGTVIKAEFPTRFSHRLWPGVLAFYPEKERLAFYNDTLALSGNIWRVVFGYAELAEKVRLLQLGLEDRAVEILKAGFWERHPETQRLTFHGLKQDRLEFYAEGLKEHEIGVTSVPIKLYDQLKAALGSRDFQGPFPQLLEGPYCNARKLLGDD